MQAVTQQAQHHLMKHPTVFDNGTTLFTAQLTDTGEVFAYELQGNRFVYGDKLDSDTKAVYFGKILAVQGNPFIPHTNIYTN